MKHNNTKKEYNRKDKYTVLKQEENTMTYTAVRSLYTTTDILGKAKTINRAGEAAAASFKTKAKKALVFLFDSSHESSLGLPADMQSKMYLD